MFYNHNPRGPGGAYRGRGTRSTSSGNAGGAPTDTHTTPSQSADNGIDLYPPADPEGDRRDRSNSVSTHYLISPYSLLTKLPI